MTPQAFIAKWQAADGSERANYPLFFNDLCDLLEVERRQPAKADDWRNGYVNERYIDARDGESAGTARYIDTYIADGSSAKRSVSPSARMPKPPNASCSRPRARPKAAPATCPKPSRASPASAALPKACPACWPR